MIINQTSSNSFKDNWDFQVGYYQKVIAILKQNAAAFVTIEIADETQDMKQATDFVVTIEGGEIAVRIRRQNPSKKYRDLTIRSRNGNSQTEIHKIKAGWARYYLYCWTDEYKNIIDWILVDLNIVRELGLLDGRREIPNTDNRTGFIAIPAAELASAGCIVSAKS